jgi:hypothetical protein
MPFKSNLQNSFAKLTLQIGSILLVCSPVFGGDASLQLSEISEEQSTTLEDVPLGTLAALDFTVRRFQPYAEDARIVEVSLAGEQELPRSSLLFYVGSANNADARIALNSSADGSNLKGTISTRTESFEVQWTKGAWKSVDAKTLLPEGVNPSFQCGNDAQTSALSFAQVDAQGDALNIGIAGAQRGAVAAADFALQTRAVTSPNAPLATRTATVAFDIDSSAVTKKFGSNANATNYLPTLITGMNASFDSPLNVQLLLGTTFIRTSGADPYAGITDTDTQLDRLGVQWRDNHAGVQRAFVMLISAAQSSGCSASGLAWVDAYCRNGTAGSTNVYGSYSANQLFHSECTNIPISNDLRIASHELGHNFGASHTHCTNSGGFIDSCFSGEGGGCYSGAQSCPAGGGTLMSYCHLLGGCSASLLFHPTHISLINPKTTAAFNAGCLLPAGSVAPIIFQNGFEGN